MTYRRSRRSSWRRPYRWPVVRLLFLLVWRLREREVLDARFHVSGTGETKGPPDYKYGKVSGLKPDLVVITETSESPYVCCGYCSAAMASWTATTGIGHSMSSTAHPIRSAGGRPHDNGSRASELRDGARRAHGVELDALARAEIPDVLRDGFAVVVNLDYASLPSFLRVQGGSFGHSCALYGWRESDDAVGFFDPLWPEGARGAWCPWSQIKPALWSDGEHSGTLVSTDKPTEPDEPDPPDTAGPPPEIHTPDDLYRIEAEGYRLGAADGYRDGIQDRDAAWRGTTLLEQPRPAGAWEPAGGAPDVLTRWSWFPRWGPLVEPETWSGPGSSWSGESRWRDG